MNANSIGAPDSATYTITATNLSDDRRCAYGAGAQIRIGQPSEEEGKSILPGIETCCDGQPPRIATSRRLLLAGLAVLPLSACPAPVPAQAAPAGISADLASLLVAASFTQATQNSYYKTVYEPHEQREACARAAGLGPRPIPAEVERRNIALEDALFAAEKQVAYFPAATPADLYAKVAFMVERAMFDGLDMSATLLADAARLAGKEA